ncbi:twin-arginine translocase subunit TatC [Niabella drilacis]|uniref:Sec-independent protein translocase protein TatC n=1 Tax=Niabella drilacis (strain DSM 25811 / CCM 8410 / CCUG 62505 / LMG 26954 / E90) TaxID=1285928 RepID=A0A1G6N2U5_NIADE|nr:twin-arginine translocase subunit TatC [Niabella drilacis]SDC62152.1 sec-independent protein translocase protein TatC [Niabella drilacis]
MALLDFLKKRSGGEDEMSFIDHLEVLRWHLIRSVLAVVVCAILVFMFSNFFVEDIIFGPTRGDFISVKWLCKIGQTVGIGDGLCFKTEPKFQETTMTGQFIASFTVAFVGGFILAFPYIFWEIWRFVKPALSDKEVKGTRGIILWVSILFFLGVAFGYFILTPLMVNFYFNYKLSEQIQIIPTFSDYLENVIYTTVGIGVLFQLPLLVLLLAKAGILTGTVLKKYRRHAFVVILIAAAIITPTTDPFSLAVVTAPLYILFEISVALASKIERKRLLENPQEWS